MKDLLKSLISPPFHHLWWALKNHQRNHRVYSWSVSRKARIGYRSIIRRGVEAGPDLELGDFSYISGPGTFIGGARIGRFCSIARGTIIGIAGKDMTRVTTSNFPTSPAYGGLAKATRMPPQKPATVIGHDVWIGVNAVIMRGVTVGHGAVIGASAVVVRDVPPYAVVGGNPARHIRDRFTPEQVAALMRIRWWDWDVKTLAEREAEFLDTSAFIAQYDTGFNTGPEARPQEDRT